MRLEKSIKNIKYTWIMQAVVALMNFMSRTAIITLLSVEYVGLSGLFSNVLSMLSLAELGIGEAITFSLYKPIANKNEKEIIAIMGFFQKAYVLVGIFILVVGISITPWIEFIIKDSPDIPHLKLIYILYVVNSASSYFFSYKATYMRADQNLYIVSINNGISKILCVLFQIILLVLTKNYIIFLCIGIIFTLLQNISISFITNKKYPFLLIHTDEKMPKTELKTIIKNTGAMVFHKIGTVVVFATDNIVISKFIGLMSVGLYANYSIIISAIAAFTSSMFNSITASVGNLTAESSVEIQEEIFFKTMFVNFWVYSFVATGFLTLLNPFVGGIWIGTKYTLGINVVIALVIKEYISGMRKSVYAFKSAKGIYWENKYMPIYESIINLVASIILAKEYGVIGVIIGTIISSLCTCVWIEPYVLYKYGFKKSPREYVRKYICYFVIAMATMIITWGTSQITIQMAGGQLEFRTVQSIFVFLILMIEVVIVPNGIMWLIFRKSDNYKYFKNIVKIKILHK